MRILFTYIGGLGHFHPLVPVARAAADAGHRVAVAGSGRLTAYVEAEGFEAIATSPPRPLDEPAAKRDLTPLLPVDARTAEVEFAQNFADKGARRHADAIGEHIRDWAPDVVVRDEADLGSAIAAEVWGLPVASVQVLAAGTLMRPDLISPPLQAIRLEHGLSVDPGLGLVTRDLVLSPFPPSFRSPDSPFPLPSGTLAFRAGVVPDATPRSSRRQRVYATLGTVFGLESGDLFERLLSGLADVDADVLVTVGWHLDPADLGPQPPHVSVQRFVPQGQALREADVVVSHGGSGALMGALSHGLPSVLLPLGADQPHNAERARELGLAHVLDAAAVTPEEISASVRAALVDEDLALSARRMAAEIAALPGVEDVVPLLEALTVDGHVR